MASTTVNGWWQRTWARLSRPAAPTDYFAFDRLDPHARTLQSAVVLLLAVLIAFPTNLFMDGDTGWHLGAGHWIVENMTVPMVDPFSHTHPGKAWTAHEWLAEILMVGAEWLDGWAGITLLFVLSMTLTTWLIAREAFRRLPARWALLSMAIVAGLLLPFTHARPHMLAWPLLAAWTLILLRAREKNQAPPLAAALLMVVWANLHASYIVAFGIAGLFGLESLLANLKDRKLLGRWILFGLSSLAAAALVTPFGPSHFLYPFEVSGMEALSIIGEWRRSTPLPDTLFYVCLAGLAALIAKRWREIPPLRLLLLVGLSAMAVLHARHQMLFAIVGGLVVLSIIAPPTLASRQAFPRAVWLLPALALLGVVRFAVPYEFKEHSTYPLTLLSRVPAEVKALPAYNEYSQGGPLVMLGVRPYIDGRADMYGDAFTFRAKAITNGDIGLFREDVKRFGIGWVLLEKQNDLVAKLRRERGWKLLVEDDHAIVFVRVR
jgi:hypothetical protein